MKNDELIEILFLNMELEDNIEKLKNTIRYSNSKETDERISQILNKIKFVNSKMAILIDILEDEEKLE